MPWVRFVLELRLAATDNPETNV